MTHDFFISNGAIQIGNQIRFRLFLPDIHPQEINVIGSFNNWGKDSHRKVSMKEIDPYLWEGWTTPLDSEIHTYQYKMNLNGHVITSTDPCCKETFSNFSSFQINTSEYPWKNDYFPRKNIRDLRIYEMHIEDWTTKLNIQHKSPLKKITENIDYIKNLGFNAIEFMPWMDCGNGYTWGYNPLHFFALNHHYGRPVELKELIDTCHSKEIAIIMDAPLNHTHEQFGYLALYNNDMNLSPFMGNFSHDFLGLPELDYNNPITAQFIWEVCKWWINEYHIDGFRFDFVKGYYIKNSGLGIEYLLNKIENHYRHNIGPHDNLNHLPYLCLEYIGDEHMLEVLNNTKSNACWYDSFRYMIHNMAEKKNVDSSIQKILEPESDGLIPNIDFVDKTTFSYIQNHDHHSIIVKNKVHDTEKDTYGYPTGDRSAAYKVKPYAIALYTGTGCPMIHNGQEFADNWFMPNEGYDRVSARPIHWEYLQDPVGQDMAQFYQKLNSIRKEFNCLTSSNYFHLLTDTNNQIIAYHRYNEFEKIFVLINFSDSDKLIEIPLPNGGLWVEALTGEHFDICNENKLFSHTLPAHYGAILTKKYE